jgi:TatD DNase family protein
MGRDAKAFAMIDSHAHVHDRAFDSDREAVIERAKAAGVAAIVTVGCDLADSRRALRAARTLGLQASIGVHPHEAKGAPEDLARALEQVAEEEGVRPVAIGEIGLDYYYTHSPRADQRRVMAAQLAFARHVRMPVIFHQRDALPDFVSLLREGGFARPMRGVVHCFTGDAAAARTLVDEFGLLLGIGGVLTFKSADALRGAVAEVGLDRLVLETDAPYLAPVPYRGRRNEPAFIVETARRLAEVLGCELDEVVTRTGANARTLFGLQATAA